MRVAPEVVVSDEQHEVLDELLRSKLTSVRLALRARIVVLAALGLQDKEIALALDVGRIPVSRWRKRYLESGLQGTERDLPRGAPLEDFGAAHTAQGSATWQTCASISAAATGPRLRVHRMSTNSGDRPTAQRARPPDLTRQRLPGRPRVARQANLILLRHPSTAPRTKYVPSRRANMTGI